MKRKTYKRVRIIFLILTAVLLYLFFNIFKQQIEISKLNKELEDNNKKIEEIDSNIDELENSIEDSKSLKFIEKTARDEYKMLKPKEIMFIDKNKKN